MLVGVLALQGASRLHLETFDELGQPAAPVKTSEQLADVDALVIPGGESTTISKLLELNALFDPIAERIEAGMSVLGTCAGAILLASGVNGGHRDQRCFGALDIWVERNGFGRQVESFEAEIKMQALGDDDFRAVFIRAPLITKASSDVEVLATFEDEIVAVRQGPAVATSFHPELSQDLRFHRWWLEEGQSR